MTATCPSNMYVMGGGCFITDRDSNGWMDRSMYIDYQSYMCGGLETTKSVKILCCYKN